MPRSPFRGGSKEINRNPQNIPLPVGDLRIVRRTTRMSPFVRWIRHQAPDIAAVVGILMAGAGALIVLVPNPVPVYGNGGTVVVGNETLSLATQNATLTTYGGGSTAAITIDDQSSQVVASGSATVSGTKETGRCVMTGVQQNTGTIVDPQPLQPIQENCSFVIGGRSLQSTDNYNEASHQWDRNYSDGSTTFIAVDPDGVVIPVPFPVGEST